MIQFLGPILGATVFIGMLLLVIQTDFVGSVVQGDGCSFEPLVLDGQEFESLEDAKNRYEQLGEDDWEEFKETFDLQVRNSVVQARLCPID